MSDLPVEPSPVPEVKTGVKAEEAAPNSSFFRHLVLVGPSGVGKDSIADELLRKHPNYLRKAVSHTTRKMREGERDGINYHFVEVEKFNTLKEAGTFIETTTYSGNFYGLSSEEFKAAEEEGKRIVAIMDMNGAEAMSKEFGKKVAIYLIRPPNPSELVLRLKKRNMGEEEITKRTEVYWTSEREDYIKRGHLLNGEFINHEGEVETCAKLLGYFLGFGDWDFTVKGKMRELAGIC